MSIWVRVQLFDVANLDRIGDKVIVLIERHSVGQPGLYDSKGSDVDYAKRDMV